MSEPTTDISAASAASPPRKRTRQTPQQRLAALSASLSESAAPPSPAPLYVGEDEPGSAPMPVPMPTPMPTPMPMPMPMPSAAPFVSGELPNAEDIPRPTPMRSSVLQAMEAQREFESKLAHEDAVAELLADLDFEKVPFQIDLIRKDPEYHPDGTYIGLGWAHTYTEPVTMKQIADKFGGGKYQLVVRVPTAPGSAKYRFYDSKVINVTGEPAIPPSRTKKTLTDDGKATDAMRDFMNRQIEIMEAQVKDAKQEARDMVASIQQSNNPTMMLELMREERRMQEARLQAEKEERAREREMEQRRFEVQIEQTRLQHEKQLEMLRLEAKERAELASRQAEQAREEARRLAADQPKTMETMMMFMQRMDAEKQANAQKASEFMFQMMQQSAQNNMQQMQTAQTMQMNILSEALREAKSKKDGVVELAMQFKTLKSVFGGGDDVAGGIAPGMSWQEIVKEGVDKLPTILQAIRPATSAGSATASAPASRIGPGASAVLDDPPLVRKPRRMTDGSAPTAGALPPAEGAVSPAASPAAQSASPTDAVPKKEPAVTGPNPLNDYEFIADMTDPEKTITALVKSLDLGLQRGLSSRSLYDQILLKFPEQVHALLKLATTAQILEIVASNAPATWAINSPRGRRAMEEVHAILTTGSTT